MKDLLIYYAPRTEWSEYFVKNLVCGSEDADNEPYDYENFTW